VNFKRKTKSLNHRSFEKMTIGGSARERGEGKNRRVRQTWGKRRPRAIGPQNWLGNLRRDDVGKARKEPMGGQGERGRVSASGK